jgi:hypothetical protein
MTLAKPGLVSCPDCGERTWLDGFGTHRCKPKWECRGAWEHWTCDWEAVHAHDSEDAAESFAERYDCEGGEYAIIGNRVTPQQVYVRKPADPDSYDVPLAEIFDISAEAQPHYWASKVA